MKKIISKLKSFLIGFTMVGALWYIAYLTADTHIIPSPFAVFAALPNLLTLDIGTHIGHSFYRVAVGLFFSVVIGLTVGILAAGAGSKILTPFIYFTYPIPRVALLPVVMLIFGITNMSKIIMITLIVSYPIIIVVRDHVRDIPKQMYNTLICLGATKAQMFVHITFPWAVSALFSTMRMSLGTAMSVLFFVESYGSRFGMGRFILDAWMRVNYVQMYGGIVVLSLVGFALFIIIDIIEETALKWKGRV